MWRNQGNLSKAAADLYLHRNTLQYRIDRFFDATGLSLKNMDDLALAYLAITAVAGDTQQLKNGYPTSGQPFFLFKARYLPEKCRLDLHGEATRIPWLRSSDSSYLSDICQNTAQKKGLSADETILVSTFLSMQLIAYAVFYIAGLVLKIRE